MQLIIMKMLLKDQLNIGEEQIQKLKTILVKKVSLILM
jgi:hypothetical protein